MTAFNSWGDPDPEHRDSYTREPQTPRPYCHECGEPFGPQHTHEGDGRFVCSEGHIHDIELGGARGNPKDGAHCPGDPDSPYSYRADE